jgi:hypothetical protein
MKSSFIAFALFFSATLVFGQNNPFFNANLKKKEFKDVRKNMVFGLSPFHFFDNSISVSGEFFSKSYKKSVRLALTGIYRDNKRLSDKGFAMELSGRYYPKSFECDSMVWGRNMASGIYLGYGAQAGLNEYIDFAFQYYDPIAMKDFSIERKKTSIWVSPFVCFGYQFTFYEVLYVDVFVGGAIKFNNVDRSNPVIGYDEENPNIFQREYKGIMPKIGFTIGLGL